MESHLALVVGVLYGASLYLMLRRSLVKLVLGLTLLAHASNLLLLTMGGISRGNAPIIGQQEEALAAPYADPVPQALILTAIVIAFGVQAFSLVLVRRVYDALRTDDLDSSYRSEE